MELLITDMRGQQWDNFVAEQGGLLFDTSDWLTVLEKGLGGDVYHLVFKRDGQIVGGLAGVLLRYCGIRLFYSGLPYGGYLGEQGEFDRFMKACLSAQLADIFYLTPIVENAESGYREHFAVAPEMMTRIDLRGKNLAEIEKGYDRSVRQSLNKGARLDLAVERCRDRESFDIAYRLYLQTMNRNEGIARYGAEWFSALYEILATDGTASVYLVRHDQVPVSATVVLDSGESVYLLHSGSDAKKLHLRANDLVVCRIVEDALASKKSWVDLMLSDPGDVKLIRWKEKFGGQSVQVNKYRRVNNRAKYLLWNGAKRAYPLLSRLRRSLGAVSS